MTTYYKDKNGKMRVNFGELPEFVKHAWAKYCNSRNLTNKEADEKLPSISVTGAVEYVYSYRDESGNMRGCGYIAVDGTDISLSEYDEEMNKYYRDSWSHYEN